MQTSRITGIVGLAAAAALALSGCAGGGSGNGADTADRPWTVAEGVELDSPTYQSMKDRGGVVIGVKEDQPGLGYVDVTTGERSGFDVDIARWIAASLGFDESDITYKAIASANREQAIRNGDIDYYVGTYSITDKRKADVDFAGPYFVTGQGLLIPAGAPDADAIEDFEGRTVCSATGSTPIQNIKANFPGIKTQEYDLYSACVEDLLAGKVDAVTTDQAILIGFAAQYPDEIRVTGGLFTQERYGIGLAKGDDALRAHIDTMLTDGGDIWTAIFERNLGSSGIEVSQPAVDAY